MTYGKVASVPLGEILGRLPIIKANEADFIEYSVSNTPPKPHNYAEIQSANRSFATFESREAEILEAGPNRCVLQEIAAQ